MINDLFVRYTTALDAGDVETIVGCFTEDGALESPAVGVYSGRQGIREFAVRFARFRERGSQLRHFISNLAVQVDGDEARATCYLLNVITRRRQNRTDGAWTLRLPAGEGRWRMAVPASSRGAGPRGRIERHLIIQRKLAKQSPVPLSAGVR